MFGYVEPDKPELKMREFDVFRGYYCSVCKTIGRSFGLLPRLSLSYDLAFLALLLDATEGGFILGKQERCIAHPLKKRYIVRSNKYIEYASDMNVILTYYSLKDKWSDEKNVLGGTGTVLLKRAFKKACKKHPDQCLAIGKYLNDLSALEKSGCDSVDEAAEPFAAIMREIFECRLIEDETVRKTLGWLGYNLGRWIYILDAWDDMEEDAKSGSYNPLLKQYSYKDDFDRFKEEIRERVDFSLTYSLSEAEKAYTLLEIEKNDGILENIMCSGLIKKTDKVLQGRCKNEKKSV